MSNSLSVCCFNRHYAEESGYFAKTNFLNEESGEKEITFYDSVSGKPLYIAPRGRTWKEFVIESQAHGWPSFRSVQEYNKPLDYGDGTLFDQLFFNVMENRIADVFQKHEKKQVDHEKNFVSMLQRPEKERPLVDQS